MSWYFSDDNNRPCCFHINLGIHSQYLPWQGRKQNYRCDALPHNWCINCSIVNDDWRYGSPLRIYFFVCYHCCVFNGWTNMDSHIHTIIVPWRVQSYPDKMDWVRLWPKSLFFIASLSSKHIDYFLMTYRNSNRFVVGQVWTAKP